MLCSGGAVASVAGSVRLMSGEHLLVGLGRPLSEDGRPPALFAGELSLSALRVALLEEREPGGGGLYPSGSHHPREHAAGGVEHHALQDPVRDHRAEVGQHPVPADGVAHFAHEGEGCGAVERSAAEYLLEGGREMPAVLQGEELDQLPRVAEPQSLAYLPQDILRV